MKKKLSKFIGIKHPITVRFNNGCVETFVSIARRYKGSTLLICKDDKGDEGIYSASEIVETVI